MFKVGRLSLYRVWITNEEVVKLQSLYQVFKVDGLSLYRVWITKEEVVKLMSVYIKSLKLARCLCIECGSPRKKY